MKHLEDQSLKRRRQLPQLDLRDYKWLLFWVTTTFVVTFAFVIRSNDKLYEFLGLAGTVTSIALAIIAIVYSYFQNIGTQQLESDMRETFTRIDERTNQLITTISQLQATAAASLQATKDVERKVESLSLIDAAKEKVRSERLQEVDDQLTQLGERLASVVEGKLKDQVQAMVQEQRQVIRTQLTESDLKERILTALANGDQVVDESTPGIDWFGSITAQQLLETAHKEGFVDLTLKQLRKLLSDMYDNKLIDQATRSKDGQTVYYVREDYAISRRQRAE